MRKSDLDRTLTRMDTRGVRSATLHRVTKQRSSLSEALAATIRAERAAHSITQQQLADAAGMTNVTMGRVLRGEREITTEYLVKIAGALGVKVSYLMLQAEQRNETATALPAPRQEQTT